MKWIETHRNESDEALTPMQVRISSFFDIHLKGVLANKLAKRD